MNDGAGENVEVVRVGWGFAGLDGVVGGGGDHGAVVGAEFKVGEVDLVSFAESLREGFAKGEVGGDATGKQNGFGGWVRFDGEFELANQDFDCGSLEAGRKIVDLFLGEVIF